MNRKIFFGIAIVSALVGANFSVKAQSADSLLLQKAIGEAVSSHPSVLQAQEAIKMAEARIEIAKSSYLPTVEGNGKFTNIGPVPEISMGGQTFKMSTSIPYSAAVTVSQLVYDFGRSKNEDEIAAENKNIATISLEQAKQRLSQAVVNTYFTLLYLQNARDIKDEQLRTLSSHLEFVMKKKATGAATEFEILTTKVRISNIESQKTDIETSREIQQAVMNTLLGRDVNAPLLVAKNISILTPQMPVDSLYSYANGNRNELKLAGEKQKLAEMNYKLAQSQNSPTIAAFASGGFQNNYFPYLSDPKLNYAIGLSLHVPIFSGFRVKNSALIAHSSIINSQYDTELAKRSISNEVTEARLSIKSAAKKVTQIEMQLQQAQKALNLAEVSYKAGTVTNLDLLDATTSLSESQLNLLKAKIDYTTSIYKLKVALGENLY